MMQKVFCCIVSLCVSLNVFASSKLEEDFQNARAAFYAADPLYVADLETRKADRVALGEYTKDGITIPTHRFAGPSDLSTARVVTVLSIDGGGARGILPVMVLSALEELLGIGSVGDIVDLAVGSSVGGLIALTATQPSAEDGRVSARSANSIADTFIDFVGAVFTPNTWWGHVRFLLGARYPSGPLEEQLAGLLGELPLSLSRKPTLVPSVNASTHDLKLFRSLRARHESTEEFDQKAVGRATSAAPAIFPPAIVRSLGPDNQEIFCLTDGGIAAKCPELLAVAEARALFGDECWINLISLGTGRKSSITPAAEVHSRSVLGILPPLIDALFDNHKDIAEQVLGHDAKVIVHRFDMDLPDILLSTAPSTGNMGALIAAARAMVKKNAEKLKRMVDFLRLNNPETPFERAKREVANGASAAAERDEVERMIGKALEKSIDISELRVASASGLEGEAAPALAFELDPTVIDAATKMGKETGYSIARRKVAEAMLGKRSTVQDIMDVTGFSKYMVESLRGAASSTLHQSV